MNRMSEDHMSTAPHGPTVAGPERLLHLRDGRVALLRPARPEDAHALLSALNEVAHEGRFLLRRAWEITPELEQRWVRAALGGLDLLMVAFMLENTESHEELDVAGSLSLVRGRPEFVRHTAEIGMWLRSAYRELGLGSALIEYALEWATAQGDIEKLTLSARSSNRRALNLYRKYDFLEEGRRHGYVKTEQGYEDEVLLARFVRGPLTAEHAHTLAGSPADYGFAADDPADEDLAG